jgi:TetR/AcrR family tetracycline transcriptional repressor
LNIVQSYTAKGDAVKPGSAADAAPTITPQTAGARMALSRDKVVNAALAIVQDHGLASLSMRQIAAALGVQPGAIYWHVTSKQELLALLADRILAASPGGKPAAPSPDARQKAIDMRAALLAVRDGAEIVSFALALRPLSHAPVPRFRDALAADLPEQHAEWGARTLTHYILGEVAEEQNHAELVRAGILPGDQHPDYSAEAFIFGVDAILSGLTGRRGQPTRPA